MLSVGIPEPVRQHFQQLDLEALKKRDLDDGDCKGYERTESCVLNLDHQKSSQNISTLHTKQQLKLSFSVLSRIYPSLPLSFTSFPFRADVPTRYNSIFPLDRLSASTTNASYFGFPSAIYKVVDSIDSQIYALRRFKTVRANPSIVKTSLMKWFDIRHPGVVSLYGISQERGMLFFTHAYHPTAQTLKERFIDLRGPLLKESTIWRIFTQLISAMRVVHRKSLAIRSISLQHVLLTSGTIARFNNVGISDVLESNNRTSITVLQSDDMIMLGHLILSLATRATVGPRNASEALLLLNQHFTTELQEAVIALLTGTTTAAQVSQPSFHSLRHLAYMIFISKTQF